MKGLFRLFVVVGFCLLTSGAMSQVTMSDIWRWGLVRKTDILPVGATLTYPTNGVLRVIETRQAVDTSRYTLTVVSNLVNTSYEGSPDLVQGVYSSVTAEGTETGWFRISFPDMWECYVSSNLTWYAGESGNFLLECVPYGNAFWGNPLSATNAFPVILTGVSPTNNVPLGSAILDYYRNNVVVTNDFVSVTMLQDAIDDLRQEISEAIEAHVQLLHP